MGGSEPRCRANAQDASVDTIPATQQPAALGHLQGQEGDEDRADHEHGLVEHRLDGECRADLLAVLEHMSPAGSHHVAGLGRAQTCDGDGEVGEGDRGVDVQQREDDAGGVQRAGDPEHGA